MVTVLRGREQECAHIDDLLARARAGEGGSLVLRGEPGIGKSALLEYAQASAAGLQIARTVGIESEREMAYAALHQLCAPMLPNLDTLPTQQAAALGTALGVRSGEQPDRFLVSLGALGLLSEAAASSPLVCVIDDAQWIDSSSLDVFTFLARRIEVDALAVVFATREELGALRGIPEVVVPGLATAEAEAMLASVMPGQLDRRVRDRILTETRGNPLALLELPRGIDPHDAAGGFGLPAPAALASRIEEEFLRRVRALPESTQELLLVAAAEPVGDPALLIRAARLLDADLHDAEPAERDGLFAIGDHVTFRHPLVRSAIYKAATADQRRRTHAALAQATDRELDRDRYAWHRAQATFGPDDDVADELEQSALSARARGGPQAAGAFLESAATLTSDEAVRGRRLLDAAEARYLAGAVTISSRLLDQIDLELLDERGRIRLEQMRARLSLGRSRISDAPVRLALAAERLHRIDHVAGREAFIDAITAGMIVGPGNLGPGWDELGAAVVRAALDSRAPTPMDRLLEGVGRQITEGYAAAVPILFGALHAIADDDTVTSEGLAVIWLAARGAMNLWDDALFCQLTERLVQTARTHGILMALPSALSAAVASAIVTGELARATQLNAETGTIIGLNGTTSQFHGPMALAAWHGDEEGFATARARAIDVDAGPNGIRAAVDRYTAALLFNGLGRYEEARSAAAGSEHAVRELGYALWIAPELVEAASRSGDLEGARAALAQLQETTIPAGTPWGLGIESCARALVSDGDAADAAYREAIGYLAQTRASAQLARAHLVYGEWLRRENRRVEARAHLRTATDALVAIGAHGFAARAERELAATGERPRRKDAGGAEQLTPQESEIARLAAEGESNADIAAQLFISPRTVEYHLHKVFMKVGVTSRAQLHRALESLASS
jgi:DNA-binding CsgD family transcriptional regulator